MQWCWVNGESLFPPCLQNQPPQAPNTMSINNNWATQNIYQEGQPLVCYIWPLNSDGNVVISCISMHTITRKSHHCVALLLHCQCDKEKVARNTGKCWSGIYISTMTTCYFKLPKVHLRLCCQFEISSMFLGLQYVTPLGRAFTASLTIWNLYKFLHNLEFIVSKLLRWLLTTPAIINATCYSNFKIQN